MNWNNNEYFKFSFAMLFCGDFGCFSGKKDIKFHASTVDNMAIKNKQFLCTFMGANKSCPDDHNKHS